MGQLTVDNPTRLAVEPLFLADEEGTPLVVPVVKATYALSDKGLTLAEEQVPVNLAGTLWGKPDWQPRATMGGTYDTSWETTRSPLLPKDFDRRFFNAASAGLVAPRAARLPPVKDP